mmetsp:Transcript_15098/g.17103  ORF Transcript_15098/g.17103 Transcript_15098/m.17103 type:complete len:408 (-) Transcript_15098:1112-2335(-)|eukprot:CAMPEP_0204853082 /NCGR_PEP_ID=MMETSP1347-20130617/12780_1 /ASSEMBLY_ACC=CAM_ASM_000690 /TAXON_ID=215587 /ORGANISM="Aplanochytrium stocchinoi, Strain GSBS06" /LENGTH=407 /DNA_ID=CAMNT_0051997727 /DNA_START=102 /DNA_END=1325 /DNA_ORIENTATION=-
MNQGGGRLAGAQHNDVLTVEPQTDDERERLVEEIKRRGNAAFKVRSLPEAVMLYSRAIELHPKMIALWSNRSMAQAGMGKFKEAKEDAEECIKLDEGWAKGYYRKAQACSGLKDFEAAINCYENVLKIEPNNTAAARELQVTKERHQKQKDEADKQPEQEVEKLPEKSFVSKKIITDSNEGKDANSKDESKTKKKEGDLSMRGYRTLADGRKTTFFNMERTEEELKLIGENKPQKLESETVFEGNAKEGSAWNVGGTFEEVDLNSWATDKLRELVEKTTCKVEENGLGTVTFSVKKLDDIEGDASKTFTRGEQRKIFDFSFNVEWSAKCEPTEGKEVDISGVLFYPEFSGDAAASGDPFEAELRWSRRESAGRFEKIIASSLKGGNSVFRVAVDKSLRQWVALFNER